MFRFRKTWKLCVTSLALVLILAAAPGAAPVQAAADTFTASTSFPIDLFVYVPCANSGAGEFVELTGTLHDLYTLTLTANGGYMFKYLDNPQGISGAGQTTGDKYQGTGGTGGQVSGTVGFEESYINNFRIIGQGTGNNYLVHENLHITVNANGTLTAFVDNFSVECK